MIWPEGPMGNSPRVHVFVLPRFGHQSKKGRLKSDGNPCPVLGYIISNINRFRSPFRRPLLLCIFTQGSREYPAPLGYYPYARWATDIIKSMLHRNSAVTAITTGAV